MAERRVDHSGLRVGQVATIILLLAAFVLNFWPLVAFVGLSQLLVALDSPYSPYRLFYHKVLKPRGIVKPDLLPDNPEPHRFAMGVGAAFNFTAAILLIGGAPFGWILVWVVIALANLNFWANICVGCLMYYQLNRLGVRGFSHAPLG